MSNIDVVIERRDDGRHAALINGEVVAKLSPYHRRGGERVSFWRIVDATNNRVEISGLRTDREHFTSLTNIARQLWLSRQPEVIEARKLQYAENRVERAQNHVAHFERLVAQAKAELEAATAALDALKR